MSLPAPTAVEDLVDLPTMTGRIANLYAQGLADENGLDWVLDQVEELVHDDPGLAHDLTALCVAVAAPLGLEAAEARARYLQARVYAERGELERALVLIDEARDGWSRAGNALAALRTDLGRMHILDDLGRHDDAADTGERLLADLDQIPTVPIEHESWSWLRAAALENLGVAWSFTGQHERALGAYADAERAYRDLGRYRDTARTQANRGIELLGLGRAREALRVLTEAADAFAEAGDRLWSAKCRGNVAQAHQQLGDLVRALEVLAPARAVLDEMGAAAEAARLQLAIASAYLDLGLYPQAQVEASEAAARTQAAGMLHDTAVARFTMALAQLGLGRLQPASEDLRVASDLFEHVGDLHQLARVRLAEAQIADERGHRIEAETLATRAAHDLRAGGWQVALAWAILRLADLAGDDDAATQHLDGAAILIEDLALPVLRHQHDLRRAKLLARAGRVDAAESLLRATMSSVEALGASLPDHAMRVAFRADRLGAHDQLIGLLVDRGRPEDLLEACEIGDRAKAQTLVELVTHAVGTSPTTRGDLTVQADLGRHVGDLNAMYHALHDAVEPSRRAALRASAEELEDRIATLRLRAPTLVPAAQQGRSGSKATRGGLTAPRTGTVTTLGYQVSGNDLLAFVVHDGHITVRRLAGVLPSVNDRLIDLGWQWTRFNLGTSFTNRHVDTLRATAQHILGELHHLLVDPIADLLPDTSTDLVIVPHRQLAAIPFQGLHDGAGTMLERWAITISPALAGATRYRRVGAGGVLVLAVPDPRAPAVAAEAQAIMRLLPDSRVLLGPSATSGALFAAPAGLAVLHIACHGLYRPANPLFSSLRLADRWVSASEVLALDLAGALVVLSACESGRQGQTTEPVGLAWAFLAAGASGVIVSRWIVNDTTTATLMGHLYRRLAQGAHPAQALRDAQRAVATDYDHPYHWAPFAYVAWSPDAQQGLQ